MNRIRYIVRSLNSQFSDLLILKLFQQSNFKRMVYMPKFKNKGNQKKRPAVVHVQTLEFARIRNAKFCQLVVIAVIESSTNATDTIMILYAQALIMPKN